MKCFYSIAEEALTTSDIELKSQLIEEMKIYCNKIKIKESQNISQKLDTPSYSDICKIVSPKDLPKRRQIHTKKGLAILMHSIAHIEYSAIDLAVDAVYRFRDTPLEFKLDWLEVADDEVRHFKMINVILNRMGYRYGDFPVHQGLFDVLNGTVHSLLERMAIVPRHYEATGLDVNPKIVQKLNSVAKKSEELKDSIKALNIIYEEEINHVKKGDRWFKYECRREGLEPHQTFFEIIKKYNLLNIKRGHINVDARLKAGFVCSELKNFGVKEC